MRFQTAYLEWRDVMARTDPKTWLIVFQNLGTGLGFPLASLFLFGLFFPVKKHVYEVSFIALLIVFFSYFGVAVFTRYIILVTPLIAILASNGALWFYGLRGKMFFKIVGGAIISIVSYTHSVIV